MSIVPADGLKSAADAKRQSGSHSEVRLERMDYVTNGV
jgi:hypothetical protein